MIRRALIELFLVLTEVPIWLVELCVACHDGFAKLRKEIR